jgi:hypothetical protein
LRDFIPTIRRRGPRPKVRSGGKPGSGARETEDLTGLYRAQGTQSKPLPQKQRLQQVFFPDGIGFDVKKLVGTGATLPVFNYLGSVSDEKKELVDQTELAPAG